VVNVKDMLGAAPSGEEVDAAENAWKRLKTHVRGKPNLQRIVWSRALAEIGSVGAAVLAGVAGTTILSPIWSPIKQKVSKSYVEPNLEKIDGWLDGAESIDPPEERADRHTLPEPEQAQKITDYFADNFVLKVAGGVAGQYAAQDFTTKAFKVKGISPKVNAVSVFTDRAVGIGTMIYLNGKGSDHAIEAQQKLESVFMKCGMSEEQAEGWASYAVNIQIPNAVGLLTSIGILTLNAKK